MSQFVSSVDLIGTALKAVGKWFEGGAPMILGPVGVGRRVSSGVTRAFPAPAKTPAPRLGRWAKLPISKFENRGTEVPRPVSGLKVVSTPAPVVEEGRLRNRPKARRGWTAKKGVPTAPRPRGLSPRTAPVAVRHARAKVAPAPAPAPGDFRALQARAQEAKAAFWHFCAQGWAKVKAEGRRALWGLLKARAEGLPLALWLIVGLSGECR